MDLHNDETKNKRRVLGCYEKDRDMGWSALPKEFKIGFLL
jgi:hypothetical protein